MKPYLQSADQAVKSLQSDAGGLSAHEAAARLEQYGPNRLEEATKASLIRRFFRQLAEPMVIVLLAAAAISAVTAVYGGESLTDVFIILFVVFLNAVLGVVQESKAEAAIDALKSMSAASSRVVRDGRTQVVPTEQLVPGDVVHLEAGDAVPADGRMLESASLQVDESMLTGESVPSQKHAEALTEEVSLGDRSNMVYMGSSVVYGRASMLVTDTGMRTEMGKIAHALTAAEEEKTPLQLRLSALSRTLTWLVLAICVLMFGLGIIRSGTLFAEGTVDTFMMAVSLAVAAIPEGLSAVVTIVLSIGVTRMSKRQAVIRRLTAVETLGCAQIICTDKTGTLTQNRMTVVETFGAHADLLIRGMALCTDAELDGQDHSVGEPTECALVDYARQQGILKTDLAQETPRVAEIPFDSIRKMMTTLHRTASGITQYTKGAPDEILARCTAILTEEGRRDMTDADRTAVLAENHRMTGQALRVLALAYAEHADIPPDITSEAIEKELTFVGLTGMMDPVRPEAKDAVAKCVEAGIRPVMITGDHIDTAIAIGRELSILKEASQAILGSELDHMSDEELDARVEQYTVYARVQPEHKARIVDAWQRKGKITAMTGDGVNDAPSIQSADIGIGMGITGTDVTKNVADMILMDDHFATIVTAVEEGRRIYANIRRAIQFLLSSNLSEVIGVFTATVLGFTILKPAHILWINLITDSLPALALGMEPGDPDTMRQPPRDAKADLFSDGVGFSIVYQGFFVALLTLAAYLIGHYLETGMWRFANSADGMTMAFLTLSLAEIAHSFNIRSHRESIFRMKTHNVWLWSAAVAAFILTTAAIFVSPLASLFGFARIGLIGYSLSLCLALCVIPLVELIKWIQRVAH